MIVTRRGLLRAACILLALALLTALVLLLAAGQALLLRRFAPELAQDPDFWRNWQTLTALSGGGPPGEPAADPAVQALAEGAGRAADVFGSTD